MSEMNSVEPESLPQDGSGLINNKTRLILVVAVMALSFGYLLYTAFPGSARYYLTISEFLEDDANMAGRPVRIVGKLEPGSHQVPQGTLSHDFVLAEGENRLGAFYSGVLPDLFDNEHSEIVLEGSYQGGTFQVDLVIVKCPSKYQAENRAQPV